MRDHRDHLFPSAGRVDKFVRTLDQVGVPAGPSYVPWKCAYEYWVFNKKVMLSMHSNAYVQ